jgi:hypothetical protein
MHGFCYRCALFQEVEIDEFYTCQFVGSGELVLVGGKRKSRTIWNEEEDDNLCLPGVIKVCIGA